MAEINSFKGRLFGGFDRRDVASYIEKLAAERNDYIVKCRDLELQLDQCREELANEREERAAELENERAERAAELERISNAHDAALAELTAAYESKLADADAAVVSANLRADVKRTQEKEELAKLLDELCARYDAAESDAVLLGARVLGDVNAVREKVELLPEILASAKERFAEIRGRLE